MIKSTAMVTTASAAFKTSPSCIACIEHHRVQLGNDLMKGTVHGLLIGLDGRQLLRIPLVGGSSSQSC
jgi:hypothetical protein